MPDSLIGSIECILKPHVPRDAGKGKITFFVVEIAFLTCSASLYELVIELQFVYRWFASTGSHYQSNPISVACKRRSCVNPVHAAGIALQLF
jgi:hypothetical protein